MSVRNILVAFNATESSDAALGAALQMQEKYGAHLTGLYAHTGRIERLRHQDWVPENMRHLLGNLASEDEGQVEAAFRKTVGARVPGERLHWISQEGRSDTTVADYGRLFDITVVGRYDTVLANREIELHPDRIALRSGRPVLVVPRGWAPERIHEHAVVAWDGSRASARAVADAMQILETKTRVTVLRVASRNLTPALPGIDVEMALARHGVPVDSVTADAGRQSVGEVILQQCMNLSAGLLVMGAFERSVFREELLGGTTRHVLQNAKLPILLAH
ncbi:universal stress protein [Roseicyclus sp. F158]|uniref:Universal stress protein n=1 Tax=Tropicimonas omnivorans TaxID=3075590 RepID=A0ABU3DIK6_9RHOB|nr:universal stress protein [Roseicyclus sp. F158]MDT0683559.1 universal stress protein [Roseicyclus sp. F158]